MKWAFFQIEPILVFEDILYITTVHFLQCHTFPKYSELCLRRGSCMSWAPDSPSPRPTWTPGCSAPTRSSSPSLRRSWPWCPLGPARPSLHHEHVHFSTISQCVKCVNKCSLVLWQNVGVLASSASGSVGWLAASIMYFALMASTLSLGEEEKLKINGTITIGRYCRFS